MAGLISAGMGFGTLGCRTNWYVQPDFTRKMGQIAPSNLSIFTKPE
jgi:hypothetical protein